MAVRKLTPKQYAFVNNYVLNGFNARQAALDAGYSNSYAEAQSYVLVKHPAVSEHLKNAYNEAEEKTEITFEWKLAKLKRIINAYEKSPLSQDAKVVIAAVAELNRMQGDYEPSKSINLSVDTTKTKLNEVRRIYEEY
jgi:phage terminase small subunit